MSRRVKSVAVVGRDAALWLTALSLQRVFGSLDVRVTAVELPSTLGTAEVYFGLPSLAGLHNLLGIDEDQMLGACEGLYMLGERFVRWGKDGGPFVQPYDSFAAPFATVDFIHYWLRARGEGLPVPLEEFSLGAAAAKQGRIVIHNAETEALSKAAHGYTLDARRYAGFLKARAVRRGVTVHNGPLSGVESSGQRISFLTLAGDQRVEADLFIDVSAEGVLIDGVLGAGLESWARWLPCDRVLSVSGEASSPLRALCQIIAVEVGWIGVYPLQDRTGVKAVYSSKLVTDQQVVNVLGASNLALSGDATVTAVHPGARSAPWTGNCIALGEAAVQLDPLSGAPLQVLQVGLAHLVSLFPVEAETFPEADIFNEAMSAHAASIRNFQIAHYKLNQRVGEPFWDRLRAMAVPDELAYKIKLFEARGRVAMYDDETFDEASWTGNFIGHGLVPREYDPLADRVPDEELASRVQGILDFISREVTNMPSVEAHLEITMPSSGGSFFS